MTLKPCRPFRAVPIVAIVTAVRRTYSMLSQTVFRIVPTPSPKVGLVGLG